MLYQKKLNPSFYKILCSVLFYQFLQVSSLWSGFVQQERVSQDFNSRAAADVECFTEISQYRKVTDTLQYEFTENLEECKEKCLQFPIAECLGFNFRRIRFSTHHENCELDVKNENDAGKFYPDSYVDYFRRNDFYEECKKASNGNGIEPENCFIPFKHDVKLDDKVVKDKVVAADRTECENACTSHEFCRTIAFSSEITTDWYGTKLENCLLSEYIASSLNAQDFVSADRFDVLSKTCTNGVECFLQHPNLRTLDIRDYHSARDADECKEKCLSERSYTCTGFNYYKNYGYRNCELISSYQSQQQYDSNYDFYERTSQSGDCDGQKPKPEHDCYELYRRGYGLDLNGVEEQLSALNVEECQKLCRKATTYTCRFFAFSIPSWYSTNNRNCKLSPFAVDSLGFYLVSDTHYNIYERKLTDDCDDTNPPHYYYSWYTVDGRKCFDKGCTKSLTGRYYYCQTDRLGAWSYCCAPGESCRSHSDGFSRFCYVADRQSQWYRC